jgi:molecular chaperone DnaJ
MSSAKRDYYEVLGVPQDADEEAIRSAYRSLARELHPDVSANPEAQEAFTQLTEAYRVLSKPTTRVLYDHFGYRGPGNGWFGPVPEGENRQSVLSDLFELWSGRKEDGDVVAEVGIDALEAERGVKRVVSFTQSQLCPACGGGGAAPGSKAEVCSLCEGKGQLRRVSHVSDAQLVEIETCPECRGAGSFVTEPCPECGGDGAFTRTRRIELRVPPGIEDGARLEIAADEDGQEPAYVLVRVRKLRESMVGRYAAVGGLLVAVALLIALLLGAA